ncbi:BCCT family transporter [Photobacterium chitinilyticum]|uniref:BCCT family transporter n=1 Tax=Photobacterium chitinilyticum TaxID=2485123 RepID=A0A444JWB8_9GAMM|nr:BCCT family transporter [Photobacterium chitinilyticum]RWX57365.1 BCCT family transporter [Photobacterium chitinilyticum]
MHCNTHKVGDKLVPALTIGFISFFLLSSLIDLSLVTSVIQSMFSSVTSQFGYVWQWLMIINFAVAVLIAVTRYGKIRMGKQAKPTIGTFRWLAMIMCTLLAGGGVFWSAAEPIYHFMTPPPSFPDVAGSTVEAVTPALSQSFLHWGFLAWAVLGTLATIVLMYAHHQGGVKLRPRALLYPLLGDRLENHWFGSVIDACSIIAVAAGTIGPIGFLASQLGYSLESVMGIENTVSSQLGILAVVVAVYSVSAFTGMDKGLQWLSRLNVVGAFALLLVMLVFGPTQFIFEHFGSAFSLYLEQLPEMSLNAEAPEWNSWWTWFFWGWFIGFAPMMAIFIARISEGRSIRELILTVAIGAPIVTNFWFTVLGGTGIFFELQSPGSISGPLNAAGLPAVLLASLSQLPFSSLLVPAFLVLTTTFVVTTGDSMAYSISMVVSGDNEPKKSQRLFWAIVMGCVAAVLLVAGDGGLNALQSFIVITAVPVSLLVAVTLITGPMAVMKMRVHEKKKAQVWQPECASSTI